MPRSLAHELRPRFWLGIAAVIACSWLLAANAFVRGADEENEEDVDLSLPGLVTTWNDGKREVALLSDRLAFRLATGESPHPQIAAEGFSGLWQGQLSVVRGGKYRFSAEVVGKFSLKIAGKTVLEVDSTADDAAQPAPGDEIELEYGLVPLEATYTRAPGQPAVLRVFWEREGDFQETLIPAALKHLREQETTAYLAQSQIEQGRRLFVENRCTACHTQASAQPVPTGLPSERAPGLDGVAGRARVAWLYHWLANPRGYRKQTTMPAMFGDSDDERADLYAAAQYLSSLGKEPPAAAVPAAAATKADEAARKTFASVGCIACHRAPGESAEKFPELISLDAVGSKTDEAHIRQWIAEPRSLHADTRMPDFELDKNDPESLNELAQYLAQRREPAFETAPTEPEDEWPALRFSALVTDEKQRTEFAALAPQEKWRELGRVVVAERGCLNCHEIKGEKNQADPCQTLDKLAADRGCLSGTPLSGKPLAPDFGWSDASRAALREFLAHGLADAKQPAPLFAAEVRLDRLGCTSCHQRNGRGGTFGQRITDFVPLVGDQTLRDIAPPELTAIGEKLKLEAMKKIISGDVRARPWMDLKMPYFAPERVEQLPEAFVAVDGSDPQAVPPEIAKASPDTMEIGRLLIGKTGFNCISCHDVKGVPAIGTRGPDLAEVTNRVTHEWFVRWLMDPQRISQGTRMPTVFFGGKSAAPQYLSGEPDPQIAAMWAYLSQGKKLTLPVMPSELPVLVKGGENPRFTPEDRPLLVRGFMPGHGGLRAIALGFPAQTHFAFDSEQCRLTDVWRGEFVEVSGWFGAGRGGANDQAFGMQALGKVFWTGPKESFALRGDDENAKLELPQAKRFTACWATAKDAGFSYRVDFGEGRSLAVEERPSPVAGLSEPAFVRRLTIQNSATDRRVCFCLSDVEKRMLHINSAGSPTLHSQFEFETAKQKWTVLTDPPVKDISLKVSKDTGQVWLEIPPGTKQPLMLLYVRRSSDEQPHPEDLRKLLQQLPQLGK